MTQTVKKQGNGYLVNGTMSVPKADGNRDYEEIQKWISDGGIVEAEFTQTELFDQAAMTKSIEIQDDFDAGEAEPIDYAGFSFEGGEASGDSIDKYMRLLTMAGVTDFQPWDINGDEHPMTLAEVEGLILTIGLRASNNKFAKKNRKVALAEATTLAEVYAV